MKKSKKNILNLFLRKGITFLSQKGMLNRLSDETYLKVFFWAKTGDRLNLDIPETYNEKLQWLKLYDRKEKYTQQVDKYEVREYITEKIGSDYLVPIHGVYDSV